MHYRTIFFFNSQDSPSSLLLSASMTCATKSRARACIRVKCTRDRPCLISARPPCLTCFTISPLYSHCTNVAKYNRSSVFIITTHGGIVTSARTGSAVVTDGTTCSQLRLCFEMCLIVVLIGHSTHLEFEIRTYYSNITLFDKKMF